MKIGMSHTYDYPSAVHLDMYGNDICLVGDSTSMVVHGHNMAMDATIRILKRRRTDAIKLEGGSPSRIIEAKVIVEVGIDVMGNVGLTPQAISVLGAFRPQGKNVANAVKVVEIALALQEAGCFAVVLESVPTLVAVATTNDPSNSYNWNWGWTLLQWVTPKFCKQYARVGDVINI